MAGVLTLHLVPAKILLAATVDFREGLGRQEARLAIDEPTGKLMEAQPRVTRIFLRPSPPATPPGC